MEVVKDPGNDRDQVLVQMVNQYQGLLLRMCYIYLRDMEQAKDATQDTFPKSIQVAGFFPWGMQREDLVDPDRYEHLPGHAAFRLVSSP